MYEVNPTPPATPPLPDDAEMWQSQPLQDQNITTPEAPAETNEEKDEFQSMELSSEKKMDLDDFLYKPDTDITPPPPREDTSEISAEVAQVQTASTNQTQVSQIDQAPTISVAETEAIIRSQVREILYPMVRDRLPTILEEIVKKELDEILKQEMAVRGTPLT
jgi:hypothetical protein